MLENGKASAKWLRRRLAPITQAEVGLRLAGRPYQVEEALLADVELPLQIVGMVPDGGIGYLGLFLLD